MLQPTEVAIDPIQIQQQIERIFRSRVFARAARSQRFLQYIVEKALNHPHTPAKEYTLAIEVFERDTSYDPSVDATVRVEAARLRSRLREFYADEGARDPVLIDVPKGAYNATFALRPPLLHTAPPGSLGVERRHSPPPPTPVTTPPVPAITLPSTSLPVRRLPLVASLSLGMLLLITVVAAIASRYRSVFAPAKSQIRSLAVLPLDNLSGDPGQDYFADGITDELITMLAKNSTLRITSRTSVMQYKGVHRPLREIARELNVDGILEGSVARSGDNVHMTVQLIQAAGDTHLWAESYDRDVMDLVSLPRTAARTIAQRLNSTVPAPPNTNFVRPEAHDAYLHGRYLWYLGSNDKAGEYFRKATDLQPDYSLGWSGLAIFYGAGAVEGDLDPAKSLTEAKQAALKAVQLDDSLPEAHLALGSAAFISDWDWPRAEAEIDRAIELDPKFAEAWHFQAKMLAAYGRHAEAIAAQRKATELDPFARPWALALSLLLARRYDDALSDIRQRLESNPTDPILYEMLSATYRCKGMTAESIAMWERARDLEQDRSSAAGIRHAFVNGGYRAALDWRIGQLEKKSDSHYVSPCDLAVLYAQLGRREKTLTLLEEAYRQHAPGLLWVQADPAFDFLHTESRYLSVIAGLRLPLASP